METLLRLIRQTPPEDFCLWGPCPVTSHKGHRKFAATVSLGEARTLQAPGSDVCLQVPAGAPGIYLTQVHTEFSRVEQFLPQGEECIVSPVVEVKFSPLQTISKAPVQLTRCRLNIPHCLQRAERWSDVKVTHYKTDNKSIIAKDLTRDTTGNGQEGTFSIDQKRITIVTDTFSVFVCKCGETCAAIVHVFLFGRLTNFTDEGQEGTTTAEINAILGSPLYDICDFKNVSTSWRSFHAKPKNFPRTHFEPLLFIWPGTESRARREPVHTCPARQCRHFGTRPRPT